MTATHTQPSSFDFIDHVTPTQKDQVSTKDVSTIQQGELIHDVFPQDTHNAPTTVQRMSEKLTGKGFNIRHFNS